MYLDTCDIEAGLSKHNQNITKPVVQEYKRLLEQINVLLDLAEFKDNDNEKQITERHMNVLLDIIGDDNHNTVGNVDFGSKMMPVLVEKMSPMKDALAQYTVKLRGLAMSTY